MGRYSEVIIAAELNGAISEAEMDRRLAEERADWESAAMPLRRLLAQLKELHMDLSERGISVSINDKSLYTSGRGWKPSVDFQLVKPNAFPPRQSPLFEVLASKDGTCKVTAHITTGLDSGRKIEIGEITINDEGIDGLIQHAIESYPWWLQQAHYDCAHSESNYE